MRRVFAYVNGHVRAESLKGKPLSFFWLACALPASRSFFRRPGQQFSEMFNARWMSGSTI
jgi:hypothetical protein